MTWLFVGIVIVGALALGVLWLLVAILTRAYLNDGEATWF